MNRSCPWFFQNQHVFGCIWLLCLAFVLESACAFQSVQLTNDLRNILFRLASANRGFSSSDVHYQTPVSECGENDNPNERIKSLDLVVTKSSLVPSERGLFLRNDTPSLVSIETGDVLCGYNCGKRPGGRLPTNDLVKQAQGTKAVSFVLDATSLVVYEGRVVALQSMIIAQSSSDAGTAPLKIWGHQLMRYGPGGMGVRVTPDPAITKRILVPGNDDDDGEAMEYSWETIGQFVNDFAFDPDLFRSNDNTKDDEDNKSNNSKALWEYEERSNRQNHVMLCWNLVRNPDQPNEIIPDGLRCVARRDFTISSNDTDEGELLELGCHYGLQYWRQMKT